MELLCSKLWRFMKKSSKPKNKSPNKSFFIHPFALVETDQIGNGTRIWAWTHIQKNVVIGEGCNIGEHCFIEEGVRIGNQTVIKNGVCLWKGIVIGDNVFVGPGAVFTNEVYPRSRFRKELLTIKIESGATISAGAIILPGVSIGSYATVGAGAVVTKNVPLHTLVFGNPAKKMGYCCICGLKIVFKNQEARCICGRRFEIKKGQIDQRTK